MTPDETAALDEIKEIGNRLDSLYKRCLEKFGYEDRVVRHLGHALDELNEAQDTLTLED